MAIFRGIGGSLDGQTATISLPVAVSQGGTSATTAAAARVNLLPSYTSGANKILRINSEGTDVEWVGGIGTGTVTSVAATVPSFLSVSGSPVTSAGTLAFSYSGTALPIANGGTGATTRQAAMDALAGAVTAGSYLRGDGTDVVMSAIQVADVPTLNQNTTGSAATLTTGRTVAITGDLSYTSGSFDGSGNVTGTGTLATVNSNVGAFGSSTSIPVVTVNAKGLVTAVSTATVAGGQYFGSAATKAIAYNANTIGENVTVTTGNNGLSAGPITISTGFAVTVETGAVWVIV
jgi:hypothetical protein